jgi:hypothetical protein
VLPDALFAIDRSTHRLIHGKVKCDERPGGCSNCERLGLLCANYNITSQERLGDRIVHRESQGAPLSQNTDGSRPKRGRLYRSCVECRISKTKCNGLRPVCLRCQQRKIQCIYEHVSQPLPAWAQRMAIATKPVHSEVTPMPDVASSPSPSNQAEGTEASPVIQQDAHGSASLPPSGSAPIPTEDQSSLAWYCSGLRFALSEAKER